MDFKSSGKSRTAQPGQASQSVKRPSDQTKDVPAPFRVSIFDLLSGAAGESLEPLECEIEMEITSTVMLALGLPGYEHLRRSPRLQLFEYIVQPGVVLAVVMYLILTRFLYGMVPAWHCLWRWMLWGGIWSQVGPMCHLVGRCKRTDYTSPQQMDLIFFGYLIHNSPPKHHVLNLYGASIPEANGTYVREGGRNGAPKYVRRVKGKQFCICRRKHPSYPSMNPHPHSRNKKSNHNHHQHSTTNGGGSTVSMVGLRAGPAPSHKQLQGSSNQTSQHNQPNSESAFDTNRGPRTGTSGSRGHVDAADNRPTNRNASNNNYNSNSKTGVQKWGAVGRGLGGALGGGSNGEWGGSRSEGAHRYFQSNLDPRERERLQDDGHGVHGGHGRHGSSNASYGGGGHGSRHGGGPGSRHGGGHASRHGDGGDGGLSGPPHKPPPRQHHSMSGARGKYRHKDKSSVGGVGAGGVGSSLHGPGGSEHVEAKWWISQVDADGIKPEKRFYGATASSHIMNPPETGWTLSRGTQGSPPKIKVQREGAIPRMSMGLLASALDLFSVGSIVYGLSIAVVVGVVDLITPYDALAGTLTGWVACVYLLGRGWIRSKRYWEYLDLLWQRKQCMHGSRRWECKFCEMKVGNARSKR